MGAPPAYSYEFEVRNSGGTATLCATTVPGGSGSSVQASPSCTLEFDQPYTWRARALFAGAAGPWSANATFRAPAGGYIRGNEVMDPLTNGRTAGHTSGPIEFVSGQGIRLVDHSSFVTYPLGDTLQEGEFSMMVLNADEGNPGDKSKIFSMQEGPDINDITTDDYRMTAELRGRNYGAPGSVTFRIIPGDGEPCDGHRQQKSFSSSTWYFWRFTWKNAYARLEVSRAARAVRPCTTRRLAAAATRIARCRTTCTSVRLRAAPARSTPRCQASSSRTCGRPHARGRHSPANSRHPGTTTRGRREGATTPFPSAFYVCLLCLRGRPRVTLS